ncbi:MAG: DUF87 domain-containing protein [Chloroflexi bacterium]|nr:DUF87 domain-containing protein [Chloroflexota bacterium]
MAHTASIKKSRATGGKGHSSSPLARLFGNTAGRLFVLALILVIAYAIGRDYLASVVFPEARDRTLHAVGYGFFPMTGWAVLFIATARFKGDWLKLYWRWWVASLFFILAAQTLMGGMYADTDVPAMDSLGGVFGQSLWGGSLLVALVRASFFACAAYAFLQPQKAAAIAKRGGILLGRLLLALLRLGGRGAVAVALASGRKTRELFIAIARRREIDEEALGPDAQDYDEAGEDAPAPGKTASKLAKVKAIVAKKAAKKQQPAEEDDALGLPFKTGKEGVLNAAHGDHPPLVEGEDDSLEEAGLAATTPAAPPRRPWTLPPMPLLEYGPKVDITKDEISETAQQIEDTLQSHGIEVEVNQIKPGPTVTLYGLTPGWVRKVKDVKERDEQGNVVRDAQGRPVVKRKKEQTRVRVDAIVAREKDMALALAAPSLRIQAPVPGESIVGIEVPNHNPVFVSLRGVLESPQLKETNKKGGLALALGQGSGGEPIVTNLKKLPHLLIAGATGSGKSVCLNTIIISLVSQFSPEKLRMLLIDPKRVELTPYNGLPHLIKPVIVDSEDAVAAMKGMLKEMFRRYKLMEAMGVRNIDAYHTHPEQPEPMPYLVIAVDELADLMMSDSYNVERTLTRLAQLGRATGIHLIVATQRPSVDVVTGLIKANFPSRISFAVVSQVDSRTILDGAGAEKLLGKGDMLFLSTDTPKPQRVQGAYLSDREIGRIMDFWRNQMGPPLPPINLELEPGDEDERGDGEGRGFRNDGSERGGSHGGDDLLDKAIELAGRQSHISTSLLQRRLRIGYPRAARLMDQLEEEGILGPGGEPGKPREVYLPKHDGGAPPSPPMSAGPPAEAAQQSDPQQRAPW